MKCEIRHELFDLFDQYSDDDGYGIFLPNESTEILDALDNLKRYKFYACEKDRDSIPKLYQIYGNALLTGPIHKSLTHVRERIGYGHIDYFGVLDSPDTKTKETIRQLMWRNTARSCFAFTHCDYTRGITPYEQIEVDIRTIWGDKAKFLDYRNPGYVLFALCTWAAAFSREKVLPLYVRQYRSNVTPMITCAFATDASEVFNKELFLEQFLNLAKE